MTDYSQLIKLRIQNEPCLELLFVGIFFVLCRSMYSTIYTEYMLWCHDGKFGVGYTIILVVRNDYLLYNIILCSFRERT